jgi:hypothetical protein
VGIQDNVRAALAATITRETDLAVAVISAGVSCLGIKGTRTSDASADVMGERGAPVSFIRVSAGAIAEPARGATITVGGKEVTVTQVILDTAGAVFHIEYVEQSPISGA